MAKRNIPEPKTGFLPTLTSLVERHRELKKQFKPHDPSRSYKTKEGITQKKTAVW